MAMRIRPGSGFAFCVDIADESVLGSGHTWASVADWCTLLIGPMDSWWTIEHDPAHGMVWAFTRREDALLFAFTWEEKAKNPQKSR